jgi:hypothetical protein
MFGVCRPADEDPGRGDPSGPAGGVAVDVGADGPRGGAVQVGVAGGGEVRGEEGGHDALPSVGVVTPSILGYADPRHIGRMVRVRAPDPLPARRPAEHPLTSA